MTIAAVLLPLFVLVALLLVLLLPIRQTTEASPGALDGRSLALGMLFFTLTILALYTRKADLIFVVLAWVFVVTRFATLFPALAASAFRGTRTMDLASAVVLAVMWALFALAILLNV